MEDKFDKLGNQIHVDLKDAWELIYKSLKNIYIAKELAVQKEGKVPTEEVYDELIHGLEQAIDMVHYGYKFFEK